MQNEQVCLYISRTFNPLDEQSDLTSFRTEKKLQLYFMWLGKGTINGKIMVPSQLHIRVQMVEGLYQLVVVMIIKFHWIQQ